MATPLRNLRIAESHNLAFARAHRAAGGNQFVRRVLDEPHSCLLVGFAAFIAISTIAEAADGCGRGWFYNGRRCVPMDEPSYYGPRYRGEYYGQPVQPGPQIMVGPGRDEPRYSPPNPAFKTWNNCPPNFTVQDGLCKPYRGR